MRLFGYYWGIAGVVAFLSYAVVRLSPRIIEMTDYTLTPLQWIFLLLFVPLMAWSEGVRGFHQAFSPRVVARANYLRDGSHSVLSLMAPLFCMGYIHATRKRKIVSISVTMTIVFLVLLLRITPQPWRGIIDAGVVTGLGMGILSLLYFWLCSESRQWDHPVPLDLPGSEMPGARKG